MSKALVLLSGGQDSITCLCLAVESFDEVATISFRYGQQHVKETEYAVIAAAKLGIADSHVIDLSFLPSLVRSALVGTAGNDVSNSHPDHPTLPASFVPNRNALFLTLAHAYAQTIQAEVIGGGMNQTDYSGYPDCREPFLNLFLRALNIGSETEIRGFFPLLHYTKMQTWLMAEDLGKVEFVIENSMTCYYGVEKMNEWGYGCGECPACKLRANGWTEYLEVRNEPV